MLLSSFLLVRFSTVSQDGSSEERRSLTDNELLDHKDVERTLDTTNTPAVPAQPSYNVNLNINVIQRAAVVNEVEDAKYAPPTPNNDIESGSLEMETREDTVDDMDGARLPEQQEHEIEELKDLPELGYSDSVVHQHREDNSNSSDDSDVSIDGVLSNYQGLEEHRSSCDLAQKPFTKPVQPVDS